MLGAQRTDGEAPKPPQISLETSLNHGHPVCTLAPSHEIIETILDQIPTKPAWTYRIDP